MCPELFSAESIKPFPCSDPYSTQQAQYPGKPSYIHTSVQKYLRAVLGMCMIMMLRCGPFEAFVWRTNSVYLLLLSPLCSASLWKNQLKKFKKNRRRKTTVATLLVDLRTVLINWDRSRNKRTANEQSFKREQDGSSIHRVSLSASLLLPIFRSLTRRSHALFERAQNLDRRLIKLLW